jgi:pyruvate dehydrogenase E2 component (dihydrolipoamide acetyltransferase)
MIVDVAMPVQGLTITEATLAGWLKQPGDPVEKGEALFEFETDKAVMEVESPASGVLLAHLAREGEVVPLGQVVAKLGTEAGDRWETPAQPASSHDGHAAGTSATPGAPVAKSSGGRTPSVPSTSSADDTAGPVRSDRRTGNGAKASPRARRAAERLGIDLALVQATGRGGAHVRERDVLRAAEQRPAAPARPSAPPRVMPLSPQPVSPTRRVIAERTAASFRDIPHFYLRREVTAERLVSFREELVADLEALASVRLTITDLFVKALALSLRAFPAVNAQWIDGGIAPLSSVDVGLAVETPNGLLVPVIRGADTLSLCQLAAQRQELVQRARDGKAQPADFAGGSFTLTNLGALGVDQFDAIINPPQSGILAVGAIKRRPFVVGEELMACKTVFLTLSMDHRVVDGAEAARFLERLVHFVERPALLGAI